MCLCVSDLPLCALGLSVRVHAGMTSSTSRAGLELAISPVELTGRRRVSSGKAASVRSAGDAVRQQRADSMACVQSAGNEGSSNF
jgi:hypothetical protein